MVIIGTLKVLFKKRKEIEVVVNFGIPLKGRTGLDRLFFCLVSPPSTGKFGLWG
jgi:hypothetical protein